MFSFPFSFILPEGGTQASLCLQDPEIRGLTTGCLRSNSAKIWEDSKGEQENSPLKNFSSGSIPLWNGFFSRGNHSIIIFTQYHPVYFGLCRLSAHFWRILVTLLLQGSSLDLPRDTVRLHPWDCLGCSEGLWEVRGLFLLLACLFWKSMQGLAFPLRRSWQGSQGLNLLPALEMGSPYQVDVCPAIICLRNFTRYHVTCFQSTPPSSLLYLHFTEGKLRPRKIKWLAKGHTAAQQSRDLHPGLLLQSRCLQVLPIPSHVAPTRKHATRQPPEFVEQAPLVWISLFLQHPQKTV